MHWLSGSAVKLPIIILLDSHNYVKLNGGQLNVYITAILVSHLRALPSGVRLRA